MEADYKQIVFFMIYISLVTTTAKWFPGKRILPLLEAKFGWETTEEAVVWQKEVMTRMSYVCIVLGIIVGTFLMRYGRRRSVIIGLCLIIFGSLCKLVLFFPVYMAGEFL